jgi:hypothetical protein
VTVQGREPGKLNLLRFAVITGCSYRSLSFGSVLTISSPIEARLVISSALSAAGCGTYSRHPRW